MKNVSTPREVLELYRAMVMMFVPVNRRQDEISRLLGLAKEAMRVQGRHCDHDWLPAMGYDRPGMLRCTKCKAVVNMDFLAEYRDWQGRGVVMGDSAIEARMQATGDAK